MRKIDSKGQSIIEYALLVFFIVVTAISSVSLLGHDVSQKIKDAADAVGLGPPDLPPAEP